MKKIILLTIVAVVSFSLSAYSGQGPRKYKKELKVLLTPSKILLVEENGIINLAFNIDVPAKYVHTKHQYLFTPVLTDYINVLPLPAITITGEKYAKILKNGKHSDHMKEKLSCCPDMSNSTDIIASKEPITVEYQCIIEYKPWMENAELITVQRFNSKKETMVIAEELYGNGVRVTTPPVEIVTTNVLAIVDKMSGNIDLKFPMNKSKIFMSFGNNKQELEDLNKIVCDMMKSKKYVVDSLIVTASSSPDGPYSNNKRLAIERGNSVKKYFENKMGNGIFTNGIARTKSIAENWNGLRALVMKSNIKNKSQVMNVLNIKDLSTRKRAMIRLPQYSYIKNYILPQLRFVKYELYYRTTTFDEVVTIATETPVVTETFVPKQISANVKVNNQPAEKIIFKEKVGRRKITEKVKERINYHYMRYRR